jgi:hypothetical protein
MTDSAAPRAARGASLAERLDAYVTALVTGRSVPQLVDGELRPLAAAARLVAGALVPVPVAPRFEARLGTRLAHEPGPVARGVRAIADISRRELRHPSRLIAAGAVSSAALGVGVTALAVWRGGRRHPGRARATR